MAVNPRSEPAAPGTPTALARRPDPQPALQVSPGPLNRPRNRLSPRQNPFREPPIFVAKFHPRPLPFSRRASPCARLAFLAEEVSSFVLPSSCVGSSPRSHSGGSRWVLSQTLSRRPRPFFLFWHGSPNARPPSTSRRVGSGALGSGPHTPARDGAVVRSDRQTVTRRCGSPFPSS